jgi:hypothetical protein
LEDLATNLSEALEKSKKRSSSPVDVKVERKKKPPL